MINSEFPILYNTTRMKWDIRNSVVLWGGMKCVQKIIHGIGRCIWNFNTLEVPIKKNLYNTQITWSRRPFDFCLGT